MPDLTTKDALLERMVEQTALLKQNIETMITVLSPVGVIQAFAGSTTPDGWLLCDGSAVSRTDYADLYAVIGDTYGDGNGSTTFNLPDLAGKFIEGSATSGTVKSAGLPNIKGAFRIRKTGTSSNTLWRSGDAEHNAVSVDDTTATSSTVASGGGDVAGQVVSLDASRSSSVYSDSVTTVQPPALTMRYIIKY